MAILRLSFLYSKRSFFLSENDKYDLTGGLSFFHLQAFRLSMPRQEHDYKGLDIHTGHEMNKLLDKTLTKYVHTKLYINITGQQSKSHFLPDNISKLEKVVAEYSKYYAAHIKMEAN
jgi:hypothetical protein